LNSNLLVPNREVPQRTAPFVAVLSNPFVPFELPTNIADANEAISEQVGHGICAAGSGRLEPLGFCFKNSIVLGFFTARCTDYQGRKNG
jgi:hypothetical protein